MASCKKIASVFLFVLPFLSIHGQQVSKTDSLAQQQDLHQYKPDSVYMRFDFLPYWFNYNLYWIPHHRTNYDGSVYQLLFFPERIKDFPIAYFSFLHEFSAYTANPTKQDSLTKAISELKEKGAFSVTSFAQGTKREQHFNFLMHFPWGKHSNVLLNYHLVGSPGSYHNQKLALTNFYSTLNMHSKNKKSNVQVSVLHQFYRFQENGGISESHRFLDTIIYDRVLVPIQLKQAEQHFRKMIFDFSPTFFIMSINKLTLTAKPLGFGFEKKSRAYLDPFPTSGYYAHIYLDSSRTYDSLAIMRSYLQSCMQASFSSFKLQLQFEKAWEKAKSMLSIDTSSFLATVNWQYLHRLFSWNGLATKGIAGSSSQLTYVQQSFSANFFKKYTFSFTQYLGSNTPPLLYNQYMGNHVQYHHQLPAFSYMVLELKAHSPWFSIGGYYTVLRHFPVWVNQQFIPIDKANILGVSSLIQFQSTHWQQRIRLDYQHSLSQWIHLPKVAFVGETSYQNKFFHQKLLFAIGFRYFFYSSYYADAYLPMLSIFYPQWDVKTDGFIYPTFFIRIKIKRALLFAETYNFTAGLLPVNYWEIPGYPLPDRGFRWGVSWMFLN